MKIQKVLIVGATGLVGSQLLARLTGHPGIQKIHVLARRPLSQIAHHPKIEFFQTDFSQLDAWSECFAVDAIFSALGTTMKIAKTERAFRHVDWEIPLQVARLAKTRGARHCFLVSALGANPSSSVFYNRVKGELEEDLRELHFESLVIARPSVLLGDRPDSRPLEKFSQRLGHILPLKWKSVPAEKVADALMFFVDHPSSGTRILENTEIHQGPLETDL